ncbi:hypothetical protein ACFX19_028942 [Malus domestica]
MPDYHHHHHYKILHRLTIITTIAIIFDNTTSHYQVPSLSPPYPTSICISNAITATCKYHHHHLYSLTATATITTTITIITFSTPIILTMPTITTTNTPTAIATNTILCSATIFTTTAAITTKHKFIVLFKILDIGTIQVFNVSFSKIILGLNYQLHSRVIKIRNLYRFHITKGLFKNIHDFQTPVAH